VFSGSRNDVGQKIRISVFAVGTVRLENKSCVSTHSNSDAVPGLSATARGDNKKGDPKRADSFVLFDPSREAPLASREILLVL